jgi:hypothetical protein
MFEHSGHYPQLEEPETEFALINDFLKWMHSNFQVEYIPEKI